MTADEREYIVTLTYTTWGVSPEDAARKCLGFATNQRGLSFRVEDSETGQYMGGGAVIAVLAALILSPACQSQWCNPDPWNGQLQQTWNTPGYYGGWTTGPVVCDPFTTTCQGAIPVN